VRFEPVISIGNLLQSKTPQYLPDTEGPIFLVKKGCSFQGVKEAKGI
jgi:hypothetical protein